MDKKEEIKTIEVVAKDFYGEHCLVDSALTRQSQKRKPEGLVEVYDIKDNGQKKLIRKNNLVVYQGRETLAQMLVRENTVDEDGNPPLQPVAGNKDHFLCWFGLGQGAADTECNPGSGDVFAPEPPSNEDIELKCPVAVNVSDSSSADYHLINDPGYPGGDCQGTGGLYPSSGNYKHPFDAISFEQDNLNDNKWMVIKITTTIGVDDANGSSPAGQPLNEAGLYTAESSAGGYAGDFALFARVTFPTLLKDNTRRLQFVWYLFL
jgi:hypothetical protein